MWQLEWVDTLRVGIVVIRQHVEVAPNTVSAHAFLQETSPPVTLLKGNGEP